MFEPKKTWTYLQGLQGRSLGAGKKKFSFSPFRRRPRPRLESFLAGYEESSVFCTFSIV